MGDFERGRENARAGVVAGREGKAGGHGRAGWSWPHALDPSPAPSNDAPLHAAFHAVISVVANGQLRATRSAVPHSDHHSE